MVPEEPPAKKQREEDEEEPAVPPMPAEMMPPTGTLQEQLGRMTNARERIDVGCPRGNGKCVPGRPRLADVRVFAASAATAPGPNVWEAAPRYAPMTRAEEPAQAIMKEQKAAPLASLGTMKS